MDEESQFNSVYEAITTNFKRLVTLEESVESFNRYYEGWKILFSSVRDNEEEKSTVKLLQTMAKDAGFATEIMPQLMRLSLVKRVYSTKVWSMSIGLSSFLGRI